MPSCIPSDIGFQPALRHRLTAILARQDKYFLQKLPALPYKYILLQLHWLIANYPLYIQPICQRSSATI